MWWCTGRSLCQSCIGSRARRCSYNSQGTNRGSIHSRFAGSGCGTGREYHAQDVTWWMNMGVISPPDIRTQYDAERWEFTMIITIGWTMSWPWEGVWALAPRPWTTRSSKDLWIELSLKALEYLEDTLTPDHAEKSSDDEAGSVEASHHHLQYVKL